MKKIVLVLAVLMLAVPVMAGIRIDANDMGSGVVRVRYTMSAGDPCIPRAFALDVTMSTANDTNLAPYGFDPNFYVAPGTFDYNSTTGVTVWGNPIVGPNTVKFITEMGSLWDPCDPCTAHKIQPKSAGTLFSFTVTKTCDITLAENALRGGVVMEDTAVTFPPGYVTLYGCHVVVGPPPGITISGKVVGNKLPKTSGIGGVTMEATGVASVLTKGDGTYTFTVSNPYTGTVKPRDPNAQWDFNTPGPASRPYVAITTNQTLQDYNATALECVNAKDPGYSNWVFLGKRQCWCFKKQCYGDTDNKATLSKYVVLADLNILKRAYLKHISTLKALAAADINDVNDICADFDHKATLSKPVVLADLNILKAWYLTTGVPDCNVTYINAWKP